MAWDVEGTKQRLRKAAVAQFAETGLAGTRVEKIAERAGLNKALIYKYFGSKEELFAEVLSSELERIATAVPLLGRDADDVGAYAGACFDYHCEHPELVRLLHWEALELPGVPAPHELERTREYEEKIAAFAVAQRNGSVVDDVPPGDLLFSVMAMAAWWAAVPQVARMVTGRPDGGEERARRRRSVVALATHLGRSPRSSKPGGLENRNAAGDRSRSS